MHNYFLLLAIVILLHPTIISSSHIEYCPRQGWQETTPLPDWLAPWYDGTVAGYNPSKHPNSVFILTGNRRLLFDVLDDSTTLLGDDLTMSVGTALSTRVILDNTLYFTDKSNLHSFEMDRDNNIINSLSS